MLVNVEHDFLLREKKSKISVLVGSEEDIQLLWIENFSFLF